MSRCLVLGARGYVGTLLTPALRAAGHAVRTMSRSQPPGPDAVRGDVADGAALDRAMSDVDVVYHLVHSMDRADYAAVDADIARGVAAAAARAGVRQIVYLGGPSPVDQPMSEHLASRTEVGEVFLAGPVPALVLRAAMVVGAGSTSFELLARAARSAPIVLRPSWMDNRSRPIAVRDVLYHLVRAASSGPVTMAADIAGPETVTYLELVQRCARIAGLPRRVPVPVAGIPVAATAAAVTDLPVPLVRALVESLKHDLVPSEVLDPPPGGGTSLDRALREALGVGDPPAMPDEGTPGVIRQVRRERVAAPRAALAERIAEVGGKRGWPGIPGAFALRGAIDHLIGGVGLHRGRPTTLTVGDTVDSWTVAGRTEHELTLVSDVRMPGKAWLRLSALPGRTSAESELEQTVAFAPDGLPGRLYWHLRKPAHDMVFAALALGLARETTREAMTGRR
ncbi:DUF2867 domain-containing protein [Actinokineospora fastidiosa]|uniref:DUF2867 domain-containing protein n=1 Tax=Actinokineospora fastidiosa TaxID=1816 RepID=UPI001670B91A|nr:DUF2867 domain-containing protein [Actinokineospora fastidiosa]